MWLYIISHLFIYSIYKPWTLTFSTRQNVILGIMSTFSSIPIKWSVTINILDRNISFIQCTTNSDFHQTLPKYGQYFSSISSPSPSPIVLLFVFLLYVFHHDGIHHQLYCCCKFFTKTSLIQGWSSIYCTCLHECHHLIVVGASPIIAVRHSIISIAM